MLTALARQISPGSSSRAFLRLSAWRFRFRSFALRPASAAAAAADGSSGVVSSSAEGESRIERSHSDGETSSPPMRKCVGDVGGWKTQVCSGPGRSCVVLSPSEIAASASTRGVKRKAPAEVRE